MAEHEQRPVYNARKWYRWFFVASGLVLTTIYFFYAFPNEELAPKQPIPFSHRVHAGVKEINCRFCHPYVERSGMPGIPTMEKCFYCHKYVIPHHPWIAREREHLETKDPVPWVQVTFVPDHVKFKHMPHIKFGKLDCKECHGIVEAQDRLPRNTFQMGFCIDCHQRKNAQLDCWLACHH